MKRIFSIFLILYLFSACSGTKHLPKGESLYIGTRQMKFSKIDYGEKWKIKDAGRKRTEVYYNLWDLPNGSLGFPVFRMIPFRLMAYNFYYTEKDKGFSHWMMNNFGEPPVTISKINPALKADKIKNMYENWGHFGTTVNYQVKYNKKKTLGRIYYQFLIPKSYTYRNIEYVVDSVQLPIRESLFNYKKTSLLASGDEFDLEKIKIEKNNIINYFHDQGYYFLREKEIIILADTSIGKRQIDLRISMADNLSAVYFKKQMIVNQTISIDSTIQQPGTDNYFRWSSGRVKKSLLDSIVKVRPGEDYSFSKVKTSIRNLSEIGIFAKPIVSLAVADHDSIKLNSQVSVQSLDATTIGLNAKANYKNIGYIGPSIGVSFGQLNLFGGAENLLIDLDGYYDFPIGVFKKRVSSASGLTFHSTLSAPLIRPPFRFINQTYSLPKKFITFRVELDDRKDYFKLISWNASTGFSWTSSPKISHKLNLISATYSNIINSTAKFDSLTADNPSLAVSLTDQFIIGSNYTFKYDNLSLENKIIGTYFEGKLELDGNLLSLISRKDPETGLRKPFGIPFSQLAQISYDFRVYLKLSASSQLAFRHIGGIGVAFGNSTHMPYINQFYIGGSNSLRPINARSVGPGRYLELNEGEVNQVGDLKLEWNLEYRLKLGPRLNLAAWTDAGNIWLLKPDPNRPYSEVRWNKIFQDSFLTSGLGVRLDISFLTVRFDYGAVLYAPIFVDGSKWIWQNKLPLWGAVVGFGLPF
jgi:outer membrane translocation and assembly module TamA